MDIDAADAEPDEAEADDAEAADSNAMAEMAAPEQGMTKALAEAAADEEDTPQAEVQNPEVLRLLSEDRVLLDGRIDEPFWARTQPLDRFFQIDPEESDTPPTRTEARFAMDAEYLYVAIKAYDPDLLAVVAPLSRRDDLAFNQDRVKVYIDSLGERRSARFFEVNPAGAVADGVFDELTGIEDSDQDVPFRARTSRFAEGWSVEMVIPLSSFAYHPDTQKPWTVLVGRFYPREEFFYLASGPSTINCTLCVASELRGMQVQPNFPAVRGVSHVEFRKRIDRSPDGARNGKTRMRLGIEASFHPSIETVVGMAVRPDAARNQVDEPLLETDLASRVDLLEKRPFFVESGDILKSPLDLLQTRSVVLPEAALSVAHRGSNWDAAAYFVRDGGAEKLLIPEAEAVGTAADVVMLRGRMNVGPGRLGVLLSHRKERALRQENGVFALDSSARMGNGDLVEAQWARSWFKDPSESDNGATQRDVAHSLSWAHEGDALTANLSWQKVGADFRADLGNVDLTDAERYAADMEASGLLPWDDVGPLLTLERTRTLSTDLLVQERGLGLFADLPKDTRIEWLPWLVSKRTTAAVHDKRLLRFQRLSLSGTPAPWVSELNMEVTWGDALYVPGNLVGSGLRWSSRVGLQPRHDLQVRLSSEIQTVRSGGALLTRESINQWLVLWFVGPDSHLRGLLKKRSAVTIDELIAKEKETAYTLSYQRKARAGYTIDAGVTLRRKLATAEDTPTSTQQMEWFSSIQWPFQ